MVQDHPTVMVVDDMPLNIRAVQTILKRAGYRVRSVLDARMIVSSATVMPPDIFLVDMRLPDCTGYEICQFIRDIPAFDYVPIIMVTANNTCYDEARLHAIGVNGVVPRPLNQATLISAIAHHLDKTRP